PLVAQDTSEFFKRDVMIPTRDGVRLHTEIFTCANARGPLPFLITRTPYGIRENSRGVATAFDRSYKELAEDGYIFVFQDIRGRYRSEGQFVMLRSPRDPHDLKAIDEGTDTYDTIDWLLKNVPGNNGRAGILGVSYGGWLTVMAMLDPHPALKAASEQASPADMFLGDDFHHNGAFRLSYGFEYVAMMETGKENAAFHFDLFDTFDWYLRLGPLANVTKEHFLRQRPTWNDFVAHPNYDAFWQRQAVAHYLGRPKVPNLNVAGWFDQEDFWGPLKIYEALERDDPGHFNYLVAGPWNHGGWNGDSGRRLGRIDFGSDTSTYFRRQVQRPWFAYWLKGEGELKLPEALAFQTGSNRWKSFNAWPPRAKTKDRELYFQAGGALSFEKPRQEGSASDSYVSDPAHPVPYRHRPIIATYQGPGWGEWLTEDQRFVDNRPDVLTWQTAPLDEDVSVAGDIGAHLFASTTGTDCDWIVKLIDVYPEDFKPERDMSGYELMVADEVYRGRFRDGFEHPKPVPADRIVEYNVGLHTNNHAFLKGHRIMVQVQSTWFPLIDRNPQKYVDNIFKATAADYEKAKLRVYRSKEYPSHVTIPVMQ
ncbi:MAG: CocE/NonD family hydrolase, partial [Bryobacteraceae bacterium]